MNIKKRKDISKLISELIKNNDFISIRDMAINLNVSEMTIRRHIDKLSNEEGLYRIHGGVLKYSASNESVYSLRKMNNIEPKAYIAQNACKEIKDGQSILIDSGTTCYEFAKALSGKKDLNIITNDIYIANILYKEHSVYMLGGKICNTYDTTTPSLKDEFLNSINIDTIVMSSFAISSDGILSSPSIERANIKKLFISRSYKKLLLADNSKFLKNAFAEVCSIYDFDKVFTDTAIEPSIYDKFIDEGLNIIK